MSCLYFIESDCTSAYKLQSRSIEESVEHLDLSFEGHHLEVLAKQAFDARETTKSDNETDAVEVSKAKTARINVADNDSNAVSVLTANAVEINATDESNTAATAQINAVEHNATEVHGTATNEKESDETRTKQAHSTPKFNVSSAPQTSFSHAVNVAEINEAETAETNVLVSAETNIAETNQANNATKTSQAHSLEKYMLCSESHCTAPPSCVSNRAFPHKMVIRNFTKLSTQALLYVLHYRNSDAIRYNMVSDKKINKNAHLAFCRSLANKSDKLYLLSSFDGKPMSVASLHATQDWSKIIDYGMYALGTNTPERNAVDDCRIPVYAIDRIIMAHLILSRGVKSVDFMFKNTNPKSLYVNLKKHGTQIISQGESYTHTHLECYQSQAFYCQQILEFCLKYRCSIEFDF